MIQTETRNKLDPWDMLAEARAAFRDIKNANVSVRLREVMGEDVVTIVVDDGRRQLKNTARRGLVEGLPARYTSSVIAEMRATWDRGESS